MPVIGQIVERSNERGTFYRVTIDGEWYSAFQPAARFVAGLQPGDNVEFEFGQKGDFKNIKTIRKVGGAPAVGAPQATASSKPQYGSMQNKKDPTEVNYMMVTKYALDLFISGKSPSPKAAVDTVFLIYNEVKRTVERLGASDPSEDHDALKDILSAKLIDHKISEDGAPWKEYWARRFGTKTPSVMDIKIMLEDFDKVKAGTMEFVMTTDGKLYMAPKKA